MSIRKIFTSRLREAIERSPYSQRKLAEKLGTHVNTVQRWLTGENWPGPETLETLCSLLTVDASWLMGGIEDSSKDYKRAKIVSLVNQIENESILDQVLSFTEKKYKTHVR